MNQFLSLFNIIYMFLSPKLVEIGLVVCPTTVPRLVCASLYEFQQPESKKMDDVHQKMILGQKDHFWAQKGPLWAIGAAKRPAERPKGHLPENKSYPELPEDMGDL